MAQQREGLTSGPGISSSSISSLARKGYLRLMREQSAKWKEDRRSGEVEMRSSRLARAKDDERESRGGDIRHRW
jgi:hypothetical protein